MKKTGDYPLSFLFCVSIYGILLFHIDVFAESLNASETFKVP